jgi:hypothetical protein
MNLRLLRVTRFSSENITEHTFNISDTARRRRGSMDRHFAQNHGNIKAYKRKIKFKTLSYKKRPSINECVRFIEEEI